MPLEVRARVLVRANVFHSTCVEVRGQSQVSVFTHLPLAWDRVSYCSLLHMPRQLDCESAVILLPPPPTRITDTCKAASGLFVGYGNPNSSHWACMAKMLPTERSPWPPTFNLRWTLESRRRLYRYFSLYPFKRIIDFPPWLQQLQIFGSINATRYEFCVMK